MPTEIFSGLIIASSLQTIDQFAGRGPVDVGTDLIVDRNHRGQRTAAEASDRFEGVLAVRGGFSVRDVEPFFDGFSDPFGTRDVAGGAVADLDDGLADRLQTKLRVEGGDPVEPGFGHLGAGGNPFDRFKRNVAEFILHSLEQWYCLVRSGTDTGNDGIHLLLNVTGTAHSTPKSRELNNGLRSDPIQGQYKRLVTHKRL